MIQRTKRTLTIHNFSFIIVIHLSYFFYIKKRKEVKNMARRKTTTSKKQKIVGTQEYINPQTGEIVPMIITSIEDRDFNFHKMWLNNLIMSLDEITNKKMELAFWIIEHLNKENQLIMTQRKIADLSGVSFGTVCETMKLLQQGEVPFLIKINSGAYQVNPNVIWKGSHNARMGVVFDYSNSVAEAKEKDKEALQIELDQVLVELQHTDLSEDERQALTEHKTQLEELLESA